MLKVSYDSVQCFWWVRVVIIDKTLSSLPLTTDKHKASTGQHQVRCRQVCKWIIWAQQQFLQSLVSTGLDVNNENSFFVRNSVVGFGSIAFLCAKRKEVVQKLNCIIGCQCLEPPIRAGAAGYCSLWLHNCRLLSPLTRQYGYQRLEPQEGES